MTRSLALVAALIAGVQTLFGAAMTAAAALGVLAGVAFGYAMCTDGSGCESSGTLLAKGALLVTLVALLMTIAPGVVAIGLLKNRRWAPPAGIVVELVLAAGTGLWLALQRPAVPDYYVFGIPAVAVVAAALMGALLTRSARGNAPKVRDGDDPGRGSQNDGLSAL